MLKNKNSLIFGVLLVIFIIGFFGESVSAADIFVDQTLEINCIGDYSETNRDCSGSDGDAYISVQIAINEMNPSDNIYLRGGVYQEGHINIPGSKNPINGDWKDNYNLLASYPGEWAVLDGEERSEERGTVIGSPGYYGEILSYWKFQRLEITGGGNPTTSHAAGFWGTRGPFWFSHCYIHDNYVRYEGNPGSSNPGGLKGHVWQDSIVEYSWFERNGALNASSHNCAHINIYSDYDYREICEFGFDPINHNGLHNMRNEYRYNYFDNSQGVPVAIKHKAAQHFTSLNGTWQDEYQTYGDKIHHNIVLNASDVALLTRQDFTQVYNNIVANSLDGSIFSGESVTGNFYNVVFWNNLIYNSDDRSLWRTHAESFGEYYSGEYYGYDFNNIIYKGNDGWNWRDISIDTQKFEEGEVDYSNYVGTHNYIYDPEGNLQEQEELYWIGDTSYNQSQYETFYPNLEVYYNDYNSSNPLFKGTTGTDKYKTYASHELEPGITITNGGRGGEHPYLEGLEIPDYAGAVNPQDDAWVDGVLGLADVDYLKNAPLGNPSWIEGSDGLETSEVCGDNTCNTSAGENCDNCPEDCGVCLSGIIFSDHFDNQPDWDTSQSVDLLDKWTSVTAENRGGNYEAGYINSEGSHGSGKGFIQYWDKTEEYGSAQNCWLNVKNSFEFPNEWYLGYWYKVDPEWDFGGIDSLKTMKIHFNDCVGECQPYGSNSGTTWDVGYWRTNGISYCGDDWCSVNSSCGAQLSTDEYARKVFGCWNEIANPNSGPNDDGWNYFIWRFNHEKNLVELEINGRDQLKISPSSSQDFPGNGWNGPYGLNFGGNPTDGGGGANEMWQAYDDIVIATSKELVEDFMGINPSYCNEGDCTPGYECNLTNHLCQESQNQDYHSADIDNDRVISFSEIEAYMNRWLNGEITINQLLSGINEWRGFD